MKYIFIFVFFCLNFSLVSAQSPQETLAAKELFDRAKSLKATNDYYGARLKLKEITGKYKSTEYYSDALILLGETDYFLVQQLKTEACDSLKLFVLSNPASHSAEDAVKKIFALLSDDNLKAYQIAMEISPYFDFSTRSSLYEPYAKVLESAGNYAKSVEFLEKILSSGIPVNSPDKILFKAAQIYETYLGNVDRAVQYYQQIVDNYPLSKHYETAQKRISQTITSVKDYKSAISSLEDSDKPLSPDELMNLGDIYAQKQNNYNQAIESYKKVLENAPESEQAKQAVLKIADCMEQKKDYNSALEYYKQYTKNYPDDPKSENAILKMASIYESDENNFVRMPNGSFIKNYQNYNKAIEQYNKIVENNPWSENASKAQLGAAKIYANDLKNYDVAREKLQEVIDKYPYSKEAEEAQKILNSL